MYLIPETVNCYLFKKNKLIFHLCTVRKLMFCTPGCMIMFTSMISKFDYICVINVLPQRYKSGNVNIISDSKLNTHPLKMSYWPNSSSD